MSTETTTIERNLRKERVGIVTSDKSVARSVSPVMA